MIFGKRKGMTTNPATRPFREVVGSGLDVKRGYTKSELCAQIRASSLAGGMPVW